MRIKKFFFAPFLFFLLNMASLVFSAEKSVIKIESAQKSEYKKDEENGIFFVSKKEREAGFALPSAFSAYKKYFS